MDASKSVTATFNANPTLTVVLSGDGSGTVTGSGIDCPGDCTESYPTGTDVTLTAMPDAVSTFQGWSDPGCPGMDPCTVTMSGDISVTATFDPII
jgi:hypothetical protein